MNNKTYKNWKILTNKILEDCYKFRNLCCEKPFDRGFIGELLVVKKLLDTYEKELCSSPENNLEYNGSSNKKWDIELILNGKSIFLNAKATTMRTRDKKPYWVRQKAENFCVVTINKRSGRQLVSLNTDFKPDLFYVFIDVGTWLKNHKANYYILSDKEAKSKFGKKYRDGANGTIRKKNHSSTDFWVEYKDVKSFQDQHLRKLLR
jgi:hypothetical protein